MIEISQLTKSLHGGGRRVDILNGIDLTVPTGQFLAITGASGSGKTTLLSLIAGLDAPTSGEILIDGNDITGLKEAELARLRGERFGFVFQNFHLIPTLTALENVVLAAELNGTPGPEKKSRDLLGVVGLGERLHHYPAQLSGGEQQRLSLARAFVNEPDIILADEPTGALDTETGTQVLTLLREVTDAGDRTIIVVTHNSQIAEIANRVIDLRDGEIVGEHRVETPKRPADVAW